MYFWRQQEVHQQEDGSTRQNRRSPVLVSCSGRTAPGVWIGSSLIRPASCVQPMVHTPTVTHRCSGMTNGYLDTCSKINSKAAQQSIILHFMQCFKFFFKKRWFNHYVKYCQRDEGKQPQECCKKRKETAELKENIIQQQQIIKIKK